MNKEIICIYHGNCADGFGAAWVVRKAMKEAGFEVEFYEGHYGSEPPNVADKFVYIVDFSYPREVLLKMAEIAKYITVIDHHKTAAKDLNNISQEATEANVCPIDVYFDMDHSGAMLTWDFFFTGDEPPQLLKCIEDRDLWKFNMPWTKEITAALFSLPYNFDIWDDLMYRPSNVTLRDEGIAILRAHDKNVDNIIKNGAYMGIIAGYSVPVVNAPPFFASDLGHILSQDNHFAAIYSENAEGRVYSLRSNDYGIDVSQIAKLFGGGGHRNAAGFKVSHDNIGRVCLNEEAINKLKNGEL